MRNANKKRVAVAASSFSECVFFPKVHVFHIVSHVHLTLFDVSFRKVFDSFQLGFAHLIVGLIFRWLFQAVVYFHL